MMNYMLAFSVLLAPCLGFLVIPDAGVLERESLRLQPADDIYNPIPVPQDDSSDDPIPVVVWHGLGDSATSDGLKSIADVIDEVNPGTYVHIIPLADGSGDRESSWFGDVNNQVDYVCDQLARDPILSTAPAIDAIGFSQGGQFLRGYIQRCGHESPRVRSLITFGSQHNGIAEFQKCKGFTDFFCNTANALLKSNLVWSNFIQSRVVPAQYYRDIKDYDNYLNYSNYLADINNERPEKNKLYAENLAQLEKFVMVVFEDDKTVIPKETGWFAEVDPETEEVTHLRDRKMYKEDWLGLKQLDKKGALSFETVSGGHMDLQEKDLKTLFQKYFGPMRSSDGEDEIGVNEE